MNTKKQIKENGNIFMEKIFSFCNLKMNDAFLTLKNKYLTKINKIKKNKTNLFLYKETKINKKKRC